MDGAKRIVSGIARAAAGAFLLSVIPVAFVSAALVKLAGTLIAAGISLAYGLLLLPTIPLLNYFFEILEHRAFGERGWPVFAWETLFALHRQLSFVFVLVIVLAMMIQLVLASGGLDGLSTMFGILVVLLLPVTAAVLAVTRRISESINPLFLVRAIVRLELGYVVILVASAAWWLLARTAWSRGSFLALFGATLTLLMLAWLIGSVVYFYRQKLGLRSARMPEVQEAATAEELRRKRDAVLGTAWVFASRGNSGGAIEHVRAYALEEEDSLGAETWLFHRMAGWRYRAAARAYGPDLSARLVAANRSQDAAKIDVVCDMLAREASRADRTD